MGSFIPGTLFFTTTEDIDKALINTIFCQAKLAGLSKVLIQICLIEKNCTFLQSNWQYNLNSKVCKTGGQTLGQFRQFGLGLHHCSFALKNYNLIRQVSQLSDYSGVLMLPWQRLKYFFRVLCCKTPLFYLFNSWVNCENLAVWLF